MILRVFQFQVLQQQVGALQDSASQNDERYTRTKADNATLQARILMLEEQLRETELRYEEKLQVMTFVLLKSGRNSLQILYTNRNNELFFAKYY